MQCNACEFSTKFKSSLATHIKSVHLQERLECDICGHKTSQRSNLNRHIERIHHEKRKEDEYYCDFCQKSYSSKANHIKSVHNGKLFPCSICDFRTTSSSSLNSHKQ